MRPSPNGRIALGLGGVVAVMVALSFAAVPFYDWFCRVTGYAGTTSVAEAPAEFVQLEGLLRNYFTFRLAPESAEGNAY